MTDISKKQTHTGIHFLAILVICLILSACTNAPLTGTRGEGTAPEPGQEETAPDKQLPPAAASEPLGPGPIALAVPLSGKLALAGKAIRAGYESANGSNGISRRVIVMDSNSMTTNDIAAAAQAKQAALLVGPLSKDKVRTLAQLTPQMPVLALNQVQGMTTPPTFYRYALAAEDSARTAAEQAAALGWHSALALVPQNDWGSRVLRAFRDALASHGGRVVDSARFDAHIIDHRAAVQSVLGSYHNGSRVDFIFIAARPVHARMIRSQLRFYHAAGLPVIGTGDIYSGVPNPRKDADLNGAYFAGMPWSVSTNPRIQAQHKEVMSNGSTAMKRYPRLYAMGRDAWWLTAEWARNGLQPGTMVAGLTGMLEVLPTGRIRRHLAWARFSNGRVKLLQSADRSLSTNADRPHPSAAAQTPATSRPDSPEPRTKSKTDDKTNFGPVFDAHSADTAAASKAATSATGSNEQKRRASEISQLIDTAAHDSAAAESTQTGNAPTQPASQTPRDQAN